MLNIHSEENPAAKIFDSLLGQIPIVGMATSYVFNPKYLATQKRSGEGVMRVTNNPALWEGNFRRPHSSAGTQLGFFLHHAATPRESSRITSEKCTVISPKFATGAT